MTPLAFVVVVVVAAAVALIRAVHAGGEVNSPDRAQVLGTYWTVAVSVIAVVMWALRSWWGRPAAPAVSTAEQVDSAADLLAERTLNTWSQKAAQLGITTSAPARVHWRWAPADLGVSREHLNRSATLPVDPPGLSSRDVEILGSGTVTRLHDEVYLQLKHGRLVLVGGPGAGKTGAMLLLLLAALRHRTHFGQGDRVSVPVPVWLTLGSWNAAAQPLREWVIESLRRDHPYVGAAEFGPDAASRLFDGGRIALFLDGLDEMPEALREHATRRMREESAGLRIVLTSRPDEYRASLAAGEQIANTAVVDLRPVSPKAAVDYLLADRTSDDARRWTPVTDEILTRPHGVLARALSTPLTLSLTRSAYAASASAAASAGQPVIPVEQDLGPARLLASDLDSVERMREHLLDQVLITGYPDPEDREYVRHWLGWLAHHLSTADQAGPDRNLAWWRIPNYVGYRGQLMLGSVVGLLVGFLVWLWLDLGFGLMCGLVSGVWASGTLSPGVVPMQLVPRWLSPPEVRQVLTGGLAFGLLAWSTAGLAAAGLDGSGTGAWSTAWVGLVVWLVLGLNALLKAWERPTIRLPDVSPVVTYGADRRYHSGVGLVAGSRGGLGGAWGALLAAELTLMITGEFRGCRRRVRFMPLLEEALRRQVLRQAGVYYQFRHAELQDRLADWYAAEHLPTPATTT